MRLSKRQEEHAGRVFEPLLTVLLATLFIGALPLDAYTDPGSGLLIWQMAGAFFVGCVYQLRKFLIRLRKRK